MYQIRPEKIRAFIQEREIASMKALRELCPDVSVMTLHRDLDALQRAGHILKIRGGARSVSQSADPSFLARERENVEGKERIAGKALSLIKPGGAVFLDAGTTCLALIRKLPDVDVTVFTVGANFAPELARLQKPTINLCCGALNRLNMAVSGHSTLAFLEGVNIDLCFIGVSGYSPEGGFPCGKESEMHVKRLVIGKARTSCVLLDATKLSRTMPYTFADLEDLDYVITDGCLPAPLARRCEERGVVVL